MKQGFSNFLWRGLLGAAAGGAVGALAGAIEGLSCAAPESKLSTLILNAGLLVPPGAAAALVFIVAIALLFSTSPAESINNYVDHLKNSPAASARALARSIFFQLGILFLAVFIFHASKISLRVFHHMGLAAVLLTIATILAGAFIRLVSAWASRRLTPLLTSSLKDKTRLRFYLLSPLIAPSFFALMVALSPVNGSGLFGFLGLLKRDELELAFLIPFLTSALVGAVTFAAPVSRRALLAYVIVFLIFGAGLGATLIASVSYNDDPPAALAVERDSNAGRLTLSFYRKLFDRDGDGSAAAFGGGDCDDANPDRYPGAIDLPDNNIDEDCSGSDARRRTPRPESKVSKESTSSNLVIPDDLSVVLLTVDALRWDIGFFGNDQPITPNIDSLARQGIAFKNAFAMSSFTGRSIGPIFVGRYPSETYSSANHLSIYYPKNQMLAEILKKANVNTGSVQGHPYFKRSGLEQGFDRWDVIIPPGDGAWDQKITSPGISDKLIQHINDDEFSDGRFFLWAHFMDPHKAYLKHKDFSVFGDTQRDRYNGEVAFADHHVGRVIDALKAKGLYEKTIIVVTSDHGEAFMEHDICFHGRRLWNEITKVPWIWRIPGLGPIVVDATVSHVDMAKTIYELMKVAPPSQAGGQSLLPLMTGVDDEDRTIFIDQPKGEYMPEMYAVIDNGYKLIHSIAGNRYQLFNLKTDPGEKSDLALKHPQILTQMKQVYQETRSSLSLNADKYKPTP